MSFWAAFAIGVAAAAAAEFLPIHSLRYTPKEAWPPWASTFRYYAIAAVGVLIGGGVAAAYTTEVDVTWYLAANVGAAWPSVLNGLARAVPPLRPPADQVN
jgi:hypothetical protein